MSESNQAQPNSGQTPQQRQPRPDPSDYVAPIRLWRIASEILLRGYREHSNIIQAFMYGAFGRDHVQAVARHFKGHIPPSTMDFDVWLTLIKLWAGQAVDDFRDRYQHVLTDALEDVLEHILKINLWSIEPRIVVRQAETRS